MTYYSSLTRPFLFIALIAGIITYNTHAMLRGLVAAMIGDTCLVGGAASLRIKNMTFTEKAELLKEAPPSVCNQIYQDADFVSAYVPYLITAGLFLSPVSRLYMVAKSRGIIGKAGALVVAGLSVPGNLTLMSTWYALRMQAIVENTGVLGKTANKLWSLATGKSLPDLTRDDKS